MAVKCWRGLESGDARRRRDSPDRVLRAGAPAARGGVARGGARARGLRAGRARCVRRRLRRSARAARATLPVPSRAALPALKRYAHLERDGALTLAGYVEASRGCKHHCRHCPIPPVYGGRFFVVPLEIVLADVRQLVAAGATHITFGDPDFLNGPRHALAVARDLHA